MKGEDPAEWRLLATGSIPIDPILSGVFSCKSYKSRETKETFSTAYSIVNTGLSSTICIRSWWWKNLGTLNNLRSIYETLLKGSGKSCEQRTSVFKNIKQPLVELRKFLKGVETLYLCVVEERTNGDERVEINGMIL